VFDQMSMPVLFVLVFVVLAVIAIASFLTLRVLGDRSKRSDDLAGEPDHPRTG